MRFPVRARAWLRAPPLAADAALAVAVLLAMVLGSFADPHGSRTGPTFGTRAPGPGSVVLMVLGAAALVPRRRAPLAVLAVTSAVTVAEFASGDPPRPSR